MKLEVIIAKTKEEKEEYFRIIRRVYCKEYKYLLQPYDKFDAIATHFLAVKEGTLEGIAAARIIEPNTVFGSQPEFIFGLSMEEEFDLSSLKEREDERYVQVSRSAAPLEFQRTGAIVEIWRAIYQYTKFVRGYTHWLNSANPETGDIKLAQAMIKSARQRGVMHPDISILPKKQFKIPKNSSMDLSKIEMPKIMRLYERMNQLYIGEAAYYEKAGMCAIPMILELDNIKKKRLYEKPGKFKF